MSDLIERQAAIDALGDMVMNWTDSEYELGQLNQWKEDRKAIIDLPSAEPQLEECPIYGGMCGYPSNLCYECPRHEGAKERPQWWTEGLQPFAQPQRIKGRWYDGRCLRCGEHAPFHPMASAYYESNFCPSCGADMREEEQE